MERVIYKINPLLEVIIQYKFPKILALNSQDPIEFQEAIKANFPIYQLGVENQQEIAITVGENREPQPSIIQKQPVRNHGFISKDGLYKINLTSGFISISTVGYTRWEDMISHFSVPLEAFERLYQPSFYERIGLRYIDVFSRKKLSIEGTPWKELIAQPWLGTFATIQEDKMVNFSFDTEYLLDNGVSRAKIHAGIGSVNNDPEKVFVIDNDFIHIGNINTTESKEILKYLHNNAKVFIRSAITDKLHDAMLPERA